MGFALKLLVLVVVGYAASVFLKNLLNIGPREFSGKPQTPTSTAGRRTATLKSRIRRGVFLLMWVLLAACVLKLGLHLLMGHSLPAK